MTGPVEKSGTVFTGVSHGVCALIGAGVLALPQAIAWLGWVGGLLCLTCFYVIQNGASLLLASLYEDKKGRKHGTYQGAVEAYLGPRGKLGVAICQTLNITCFVTAYTITAAISMQEMSEKICSNGGSCLSKTWQLTLIFGGIQLFFSQMPNLESAWWMSAIGALMSILYSGIALGLSIANAGNGHGSVAGIEASPADKAFGALNSLGTLAFAFSFSTILLEIQDTLREPPKAVRTMRTVIIWSLGISFGFYLLISIMGYLAFGNTVPSDILTGFDGPNWLIVLANGFVVVHMVSAYQVYAQPLFVLVEWKLCRRFLRHRPGPHRSPHSATSAAAASRGPSATAAGGQEQHVRWANAAADPTGPAAVAAAASGAAAGAAAGAACPRQLTLELKQLSEREADLVDAAVAAESAATAPAAANGGKGPELRISMSPFDGHHQALPDEASMAQLQKDETDSWDEEQPPALSPNLSQRYSVTDFHFHLSPAPLWMRLAWRSAYVAVTTLVAVVCPFFSEFVGLVGGLMFWPLSIGFPLACWFAVRNPRGWVRRGAIGIAAVMLLVGLAAVVGSVRNIIQSWSSFSIF